MRDSQSLQIFFEILEFIQSQLFPVIENPQEGLQTSSPRNAVALLLDSHQNMVTQVLTSSRAF